MNLLIMALMAVLVGSLTMGALVWAYFAEDRACASASVETAEKERVDA